MWTPSGRSIAARFSGASVLSMPCAASARAPGRAGSAPPSSTAPAPDARSISSKCPARPNPVTSVQALTANRRSTAAAAPLLRAMLSSAAASQSTRANPRICAANTIPVPSGLVRISASPARSPDLRQSAAGSPTPVTAKPSAASPPSALCPPISAQPSPRSTAFAPSIIARKSWPMRRPGMNGRAAIAIAVQGRAPIA